MLKKRGKQILSWGVPLLLMGITVFVYRSQSLWICQEDMTRTINWNGVFGWLASIICLVPVMAYVIRKIWEFFFEEGWKRLVTFLKNCKKRDNLQRGMLHLLFMLLIFVTSCSVDWVYEKIVGGNSLRSSFVSYRVLFFLAIGIMIYVLWQVYKERIRQIEVVVVITIICMGSMIALGTPAQLGVSWDDKIHYNNVKQYSYFIEYQLSESEDELIKKSDEGGTYIEYQLSKIKSDRERLNSQYDLITVVQKINRDNVYQSVAYLPGAIIHFMCRQLNMSFLTTFIMGRWINIFVYALIVYQAVKRLKSGKMILAAVALFPTGLFEAANYNYDFWVNGFAMLGVASIIGILQDASKKISWKDTLIIFWAFIIGFGPKAIYFPLLFLVFLIKKEQFRTKKDCRICRWLLIAAIVLMFCSFAVPFLTAGVGGNDMRGGSEVNSVEQIKFILMQPLSYAKILFNYLKFYLSFELFSYYATCLGYLTHPNPGKHAVELLMFFITVVLTDRRKENGMFLNWKNRAWVFGINIGVASLIVTVMYVAYTAVGATTVNGCQARYLIPLLFPMAYFCGSKKIDCPWKESKFFAVILGISNLFIAYEFWSCCVQRYF